MSSNLTYPAFALLLEGHFAKREKREVPKMTLRSLMEELDSEEWEQYRSATTVLSQRWFSEKRIQEQIREYEKEKEKSNAL